jgi:hypothetical protein
VSIATGRVEFDSLAEGGFGFGEFLFAEEAAAVFLKTIRFGCRRMRPTYFEVTNTVTAGTVFKLIL